MRVRVRYSFVVVDSHPCITPPSQRLMGVPRLRSQSKTASGSVVICMERFHEALNAFRPLIHILYGAVSIRRIRGSPSSYVCHRKLSFRSRIPISAEFLSRILQNELRRCSLTTRCSSRFSTLHAPVVAEPSELGPMICEIYASH